MKKIRGLPQWLLAIVCAALIVAIWLLISFVLKFGFTPSDSQENWGQFGDFVGGILNPLFSIIGLLALLHTIVLQSKELASSTKELRSSAKALKRQNKHNARQQFDNNLFQLMNLNIAKVDSVVYRSQSEKRGDEAFERAYFYFTSGWDLESKDPQLWMNNFRVWRSDIGVIFDTYVHSLSNIISFIYNAPVSGEAKEFAYTTITSNLSSEVLTIYFLFAVFSNDHNWAREMLEEIDFFGHCQMDYLNYEPVLAIVGVHSVVSFD
ncbi:MAG: hypothetical protein ABWY17_17210 [Pseudomonas sp.]